MIRRPPRSTLSSSSAASDVYKRQIYGYAGSLLAAASHVERSIVFANDAMHHSQTESSAFSGFLGREERFEEARDRLLVHALTLVLDDESSVPSGLETRYRHDACIVREDLVHRDRHSAQCRTHCM